MQFNSPKNPGVGIDNPSFTDEEIEVHDVKSWYMVEIGFELISLTLTLPHFLLHSDVSQWEKTR